MAGESRGEMPLLPRGICIQTLVSWHVNHFFPFWRAPSNSVLESCVLSTECSLWIIPPEMLAVILPKTQMVRVVSKAQVCFVFVNANAWVSQTLILKSLLPTQSFWYGKKHKLCNNVLCGASAHCNLILPYCILKACLPHFLCCSASFLHLSKERKIA